MTVWSAPPRLGGFMKILACAGITYAGALSVLGVLGLTARHRIEAGWFIAAALAAIAGVTLRHSKMDVWVDRPDAHLNRRLILAVAVLASCAFYSPSIGVGLLSDDFVLLPRAADGVLSMGNEFVRPLPLALWSVIIALTGESAGALHLLNITLHGVNAALVCELAVAIGMSRAWSLAAGACFLVHPAAVEPVVWISGLFDVAMTAGVLCVLLATLSRSASGAAAALPLALLSKETGVIAGPIAVLWAFVRQDGRRVALFTLVTCLVFLVGRVVALPPPADFSSAPDKYLIKEMISRTIAGTLSPWPRQHSTLVAMLGTAGVIFAVFRTVVLSSVRRHLVFDAVFVLSLLLSVLPVYRYLFVTSELENSRYLYLGVAFASLWLAHALGKGEKVASVGAAAMALLLLLLSTSSLARQSDWWAAADLRDLAFDSAVEVARRESCRSVTAVSVPDQVRGAFVLRNGFAEAFRRRWVHRSSDGLDCLVRWDGTAFVMEGAR